MGMFHRVCSTDTSPPGEGTAESQPEQGPPKSGPRGGALVAKVQRQGIECTELTVLCYTLESC